jgi:hypothetical protein
VQSQYVEPLLNVTLTYLKLIHRMVFCCYFLSQLSPVCAYASNLTSVLRKSVTNQLLAMLLKLRVQIDCKFNRLPITTLL